MLIDVLREFNIDFCAVNRDNVTDIVLMQPYLPFANYPEHCAAIDSFYIASNELYNRKKSIEQSLREHGFEVLARHFQLKAAGEAGGLGSILHNQLLVNNKYGSRTTLQGISVVGSYEYIADGRVQSNCDLCGLCSKVCPCGALQSGKFIRQHCIRHKQDFAADYYAEVGGRVLGCEECQNVCPHNAMVGSVQMPGHIEKLFDYDNIFDMIMGGKHGLQPLAELIGSNMARPTYIFNLVVNSLISQNNCSYSGRIRQFAAHPSEAIRHKVEFYFSKKNEI